ncbi:MAG TPA: hypothetical protein VFS50_02810 [Meiothermus sp.]|nr:hypothetical protein [Meiothermus sp.]
MRKVALTLIAACLGGASLVQPTLPFVDIPPCHWAAQAVGQIVGQTGSPNVRQ